ncbi:MAG: MFS transporter [Bdellovibrionota bacterium]
MERVHRNAEGKAIPISTVAKMGIIVAALGYFVDIYDLVLFSIVRVRSLQSLGFTQEELLPKGAFLLNVQMTGLLLGGILWGVLGDKIGRVKVLFGSILLYSLANIANGFAPNIELYALARFCAGIGLAGELGAGITLVSESMSTTHRGYGTTIVATVGVLGAIVAGLVSDLTDWRTSYFVGGGLGLLLLALRIGVYESGLFEQMRGSEARRGDIRLLFSSKERLIRYLCCILSGAPVWYVVGIFITFAPEFAKALALPEMPTASRAVLWCYVGLTGGDLASGVLSQMIQSRRTTIRIFLTILSAGVVAYLNLFGASLFAFYAVCVWIGFGVGYWAVFVSSAAEHFGTNLRATVTTTVPNFVRGLVVPFTTLFQFLNPRIGTLQSGAVGIAIAIVVAFVSLSRLEESYGKDLVFLEE